VAAGVIATQAGAVLKDPTKVVKTVLAAVFFSVLMQAWHLPVGPSELHLIGATTVYLLFGFSPTVVGFGLGLFLQAFFFEPEDMLHLGVNALSLMLPIAAVHYSFGRRLFDKDHADRFTLGRVLRIDAVYYAGVTAMVGFWLGISNDAVAVSDWARWAIAYLPVFGAEALLTFTTVTVLSKWKDRPVFARFSELGHLRFAA
jgi:ABC-type Co2+ transport system permease subunit